MIAEEVAELDDEHAAAVEKLIIGRAPDLTSGQLRALVRRAVLSADPKAARRRKEKALKDARVEMFPETSGTAALAGRDLPPAGVLAADKHLTALAQAMKAAGQPGTLDILRAWAYLHLLSGQPAATLIPTQHARPPTSGLPGSDPPGGPGLPMTVPDAAPAPGGLRGSVNLTMPLSTWLGWTQSPGDVPGYGPVDAEDSRTLASLLARSPGNQWCVTLTGADGHPVAHACARHGPPSPGQRPTPATLIPRQRASPVPGQRPSPVPGQRPSPATPVPDWLRGLAFVTLETGTCTHPRESRGYQPSPSLRHLIQIRNPTCTGPGCRRPATRCDLDHVIPLRPRRTHLRMQRSSGLPPRSPHQASPGLDRHPGPAWHPHLDHPRPPQLYHHPRRVPGDKRRASRPGRPPGLPGPGGRGPLRRGGEVDVAGLDRARGPAGRRLVGPVEVGVGDDLLGRR